MSPLAVPGAGKRIAQQDRAQHEAGGGVGIEQDPAAARHQSGDDRRDLGIGSAAAAAMAARQGEEGEQE